MSDFLSQVLFYSTCRTSITRIFQIVTADTDKIVTITSTFSKFVGASDFTFKSYWNYNFSIVSLHCNTPQGLVNYANDFEIWKILKITEVTNLYMLKGQIFTKPEEVKIASEITYTL